MNIGVIIKKYHTINYINIFNVILFKYEIQYVIKNNLYNTNKKIIELTY